MNLYINARQLFTPAVQKQGGFTWTLCVQSGLHALFPTDLLPYKNNHNPQLDQNPHKIDSRSVPQISRADASGWCGTAREAQTSYTQAFCTSVLSYGRHFPQLFRDLLCCTAGLITAVFHRKGPENCMREFSTSASVKCLSHCFYSHQLFHVFTKSLLPWDHSFSK